MTRTSDISYNTIIYYRYCTVMALQQNQPSMEYPTNDNRTTKTNSDRIYNGSTMFMQNTSFTTTTTRTIPLVSTKKAIPLLRLKRVSIVLANFQKHKLSAFLVYLALIEIS